MAPILDVSLLNAGGPIGDQYMEQPTNRLLADPLPPTDPAKLPPDGRQRPMFYNFRPETKSSVITAERTLFLFYLLAMKRMKKSRARWSSFNEAD